MTVHGSGGGLERLHAALEAHRPRILSDDRKIEAAVAVVVRERAGGLEVLLIHRAHNPVDPWSGHMAFPGGRVEEGDGDSLSAAVRETSEEVGLDLRRRASQIGRLSDATPRGGGRRLGVVIVPHVFSIEDDPPLAPNEEVQDVVWVPLGYLADRSNRSTMWWRRGILPVRFPCCRYRGFVIWGVTLRILDEMIEVVRESDESVLFSTRTEL